MIAQAKIEACRLSENIQKNQYYALINPNINARAYYVYDFTDKNVLIAKNENEPLPLASLTKLMTVRVVRKLSHEQTILYAIKDIDIEQEGDSGLTNGMLFNLYDLEHLALIASSNDAAHALAQTTGIFGEDFFKKMNNEAQNLGFTSLSFESVTGLDTEDELPTAKGSARDITHLLYTNEREYPEVFDTTKETSMTVTPLLGGTPVTIKNTNRALPEIPGLIAGKTGYTISAGGNLAILWKDTASGHTLGATILGESEDGRFNAMIAIVNGISTINQIQRPLSCISSAH